MGLGSAMVLAGVNAIILDRFEPRDRAKAIGIAGAVVGIGLSAGPLAGGWLLDTLGWRALFYTRMPISLMAAGLSWWVLEDRDSSRPRDFTVDWFGAVALFTVLASFLVVVNRSAGGWILLPPGAGHDRPADCVGAWADCLTAQIRLDPFWISVCSAVQDTV